nr:immunoglobulin heavy chain junction region [Macaca mulatta]
CARCERGIAAATAMVTNYFDYW